jgi:parallel beta-helix repeat protein
LINNTVISNGDYGILISYSNNNQVVRTRVRDSFLSGGIGISNANNNTLIQNNLSDNRVGFKISKSINNTFVDNIMVGDGMMLTGTIPEHANSHYIDITNTINGKPVRYLKDQTGGSVLPDAGEVILANCTNVIVEEQNLTGGSIGAELIFSSNITIKNTNTSNNYYGIYFEHSDNNSLLDITSINNDFGIYIKSSNNNTFTDNDFSHNIVGIFLYTFCMNNTINNNTLSYSGTSFWGTGIRITESSYNRIENNQANYNIEYGIHIEPLSHHNSIIGNVANNNNEGILVESSNRNIISNNSIYSNTKYGIDLDSGSSFNNIENNTIDSNVIAGIKLLFNTNNNTMTNNSVSNSNDGIYVQSAKYNTIIGNKVFGNDRGIRLSSSTTSGNDVLKNDVINNNKGIEIQSSVDNDIYHNNIIKNNIQGQDTGAGNRWNSSYPSGGNFWSDYMGYDEFQGPNQDIPGNDDIGDSNYSIDSDSEDIYPLLSTLGSSIFLYEGWNLISLPNIQTNTSLGAVFNSIAGSYDAVQWYNTIDSNDHWKHSSVYKSSPLNDLSYVNNNMGVFIHITQIGGVLFKYLGLIPNSNQSITLSPGWNLVGYPTLTNYNRSAGLNNLDFGNDVDAIQWYNGATKTWHIMGPDDIFVIGRGYWIHSKVTKTWDVPL